MSYRHDWLQKKIYNSPSLAGISSTGLIQKMQEFALIKHGQEMVVPDLAFVKKDNLYLVEIKGNPGQWCMNKYKSQAQRITTWYESENIQTPNIRLVHPNKDWYKDMFDMLGDLNVEVYKH